MKKFPTEDTLFLILATLLALLVVFAVIETVAQASACKSRGGVWVSRIDNCVDPRYFK